MSRKSVPCSITGLLLASIPAGVLAYGGSYPDIRPNGWAYPVSEYRSSDTCGGQFQLSEYPGHVGVDLCRDVGTPVLAIADGCVQDYDPSASDYGGVGVKGGVTLLRHITETGRFIYTVYGHITLNVDYLRERGCDVGPKMVKKGDEMGKIAVYVGSRNHLHFGIHPDTVGVKKYQGNDCYSSDNCGWVDPFQFLMNNRPTTKPVSSSCIGTTCGDAVLFRAKLSAPKLVLFGASLYSVTDVGWWPTSVNCESAAYRFYLTPKYMSSEVFRAVPAPSSICASVIRMCSR